MNRENFGIYKAIIVGGGASGLALSICLSNKFSPSKVALFEKLDRVGKKILVTGNGQCNLTNEVISSSNFHSENNGFSNSIIDAYGNKAVVDFFTKLGVPLVVEDSKFYPMSKQASSILDAMRFKIGSTYAQIFTACEVVSAVKKNGVFEVKCLDGKVFYCENLIISVGGQAQKHLGSDGKSYSLLESFGHKKTKLFPSIVQLKCDMSKIKGLKGLKQKATVTATVNGNAVKSFNGDLLFTEYGVSGNTIFNISPYVVGKTNCKLAIDFCSDIECGELEKLITAKKQNCSYLTAEHLLSGIMNNKIAVSILKILGYNPNCSITEISAKKVAYEVKNFTLDITGSMGFDNAQVTKGGISTVDFDNKTLQSKLVSGLYAIGEVLDVDGDCGGYNLTWAFSSAFAVADSIR